MRKVKIITADVAANLIKDNDTLTSMGFVACAHPEALTKALEKRFLETGSPKNLTYTYSASQGNRTGIGAEHLAHEGLLKRLIIGHYQTVPALARLAVDNKIEAYNFSQGTMCHMFRAMAGRKIGVFTGIGLHTFLDPRYGGGRINERTTEDIVKLVTVEGQEQLFYPTFPIDAAFLRGSYADEAGNITTEEEVAPLENTTVAQAVHNNGGIVIVQVKKVVAHGSLDPRLVTIPGIYVDYIVVADEGDHEQAFGCKFDPTLCGDRRAPENTGGEALPLSAKKIIGRRGALMLKEDVVVNLGVYNIAVMLHDRNNHFIAFLHLTVGKRRSQQVDTLRRAPCKHDFIATACIDKTTYSFTRSFMQLGSLLRQEMHTTMHIGIDRIIFIGYGFNHLARFLSGSPIIQINKRLSIHLPI